MNDLYESLSVRRLEITKMAEKRGSRAHILAKGPLDIGMAICTLGEAIKLTKTTV